MSAANQGKGDEPKVPPAMRSLYDSIVALTDPFCYEYLNEEYAALSRKLTAALARKRPSPLTSGTTRVWACAIVRVIGWVNFLDDKSSEPHMKLTEIDARFGVAQSTAQNKSKSIRDTLRIHQFDFNWMLRSVLAKSTVIWMISVDGLIMDARDLPREIQEAAFRKGIIPYIYADNPPNPDIASVATNTEPSESPARRKPRPDDDEPTLPGLD